MKLIASTNVHPKDRICLALDTHDRDYILRTVDELVDLVGYFKLNSAFTLYGPELVTAILARKTKVFLDLKLHDIPNTLDGYGDVVTRLGVHVVTVHVAGGSEMLRNLVSSADRMSAKLESKRPLLIGITLMTSISQQMLNSELGIAGSVQDEVLRKTRLAADCGLDGVVCSAGELDFIRPHVPPSFMLVTPGVRPPGAGYDDHHRAYSYSAAIRAGSHLLVVGRSVLGASDPRGALLDLHQEILRETQA